MPPGATPQNAVRIFAAGVTRLYVPADTCDVRPELAQAEVYCGRVGIRIGSIFAAEIIWGRGS